MYEENLYNQTDAKGRGGGGGGKDQFTEGQNPNYDSARFPKARNINEFKGLLRYHKPHVIDYIAFTYMFLYADSLYCCVYSKYTL